MKRLFASSLLCLAMFALPAHGATAAIMTVCDVGEAVGLSMPERHAAIKAEAEAGMDQMEHARCDEASAGQGREIPVWHDAHPAGGTTDQPSESSHHAHLGAGQCHGCGTEAANTALLIELPLAALQHQRHALPLISPVSVANQISLSGDKSIARHC